MTLAKRERRCYCFSKKIMQGQTIVCIFLSRKEFFFAVFLTVKKDEGKQKKSENSHQSFVAAVARFSTTLLSNYEQTGCRSQSRNSSISTLLLESRQTFVWRVRKWMNFIKYLSHFSIFFHQPNRQQYFHFLAPSNLFFFHREMGTAIDLNSLSDFNAHLLQKIQPYWSGLQDIYPLSLEMGSRILITMILRGPQAYFFPSSTFPPNFIFLKSSTCFQFLFKKGRFPHNTFQ